jgi:hypothetical protein
MIESAAESVIGPMTKLRMKNMKHRLALYKDEKPYRE